MTALNLTASVDHELASTQKSRDLKPGTLFKVSGWNTLWLRTPGTIVATGLKAPGATGAPLGAWMKDDTLLNACVETVFGMLTFEGGIL